MIDVWAVASHFLWIAGLATLLATWSAARAAAMAQGRGTRAALQDWGYALALDAGLLLFCAGMAAADDRLWARALWMLLALAALGDAGRLLYARG